MGTYSKMHAEPTRDVEWCQVGQVEDQGLQEVDRVVELAPEVGFIPPLQKYFLTLFDKTDWTWVGTVQCLYSRLSISHGDFHRNKSDIIMRVRADIRQWRIKARNAGLIQPEIRHPTRYCRIFTQYPVRHTGLSGRISGIRQKKQI